MYAPGGWNQEHETPAPTQTESEERSRASRSQSPCSLHTRVRIPWGVALLSTTTSLWSSEGCVCVAHRFFGCFLLARGCSLGMPARTHNNSGRSNPFSSLSAKARGSDGQKRRAPLQQGKRTQSGTAPCFRPYFRPSWCEHRNLSLSPASHPPRSAQKILDRKISVGCCTPEAVARTQPNLGGPRVMAPTSLPCEGKHLPCPAADGITK